jgi:hypothetical protein
METPPILDVIIEFPAHAIALCSRDGRTARRNLDHRLRRAY